MDTIETRVRRSSRHPRLWGACTALLLLVLVAAGCGGKTAASPAVPEAAGDGRFALTVLDDSIYGSGRFELQVEERADAVDVAVVGRDVDDLRGLYFELSFDGSQYNPTAAQASPALRDSGTVLELGVLDRRDMVTHGQVLANWDSTPGYSGNGVVATVSFEQRPQAEARSASSVPTGNTAQAPVQVFAGPSFSGEVLSVSIQYTNPGDYDQNGEVGITDLTPLGLHFGEVVDTAPITGIYGIQGFPVQTVIDGDGNGEINIGDITPIGTNFGNDVLGGYNVYASADPGDIPDTNDATSTIVPAGTSAGGSVHGFGDASETRLAFRYFQTTVPPTSIYFWARPVSGTGDEGTISEVFQLVDGPGPQLDLDAAPIGGTGTEEDPYEVEATTDHQIRLTHAIAGDVTTDPHSAYYMYGFRDFLSGGRDPELIIREVSFTADGLGELDESTGALEILDIYEGQFLIQALYGGRMSNILYLLVPDPDNIGPVAVIDIEDDGGDSVPRTVRLSGGNSVDTDGDIAAYEWDLGNDGTYEEINPGPAFEFDITEGGAMPVKLRVTDDDGASATTMLTLQTTGWQRTVLDEVSETSPADPMVQIIDGNPAVAYRQFNTLKYIRAADAAGTSWNDSVAVPLSVTAQHICLRDLGGRPAMAYQRSGVEAGIYYVLGNTANATSFDQVRITSSADDHSPTLNVIDGNPALAYAWHTGDADPYTLLYIRSSDSLGNTGGAWDLITAGYVVDGETFLLDKTALQITDADLPGTDGRPCLMYIADNDEFGVPWRMCFSKATTASAFSWSLPITISNNGGNEISYPSVTSIVSRPRIAYFNPGAESVTYNATPNLNGFNWMGAIELPLGSEPGRGYFPSLANVAGFCGIAYYDAGDDCIRYIATDDPEGDTGWAGNGFVSAAGEYDTSGSLNAYISLGAAQGKPVIVYHDVASAELVYSTYYEAP